MALFGIPGLVEASLIFIFTRYFPCVTSHHLLSMHLSLCPSSFYKDTNHIGLGSIFIILTNYKYGHILRFWGFGLQHILWGGKKNQLIIPLFNELAMLTITQRFDGE